MDKSGFVCSFIKAAINGLPRTRICSPGNRFVTKDELLPLMHDLGIGGHKDDIMMLFYHQVNASAFCTKKPLVEFQPYQNSDTGH